MREIPQADTLQTVFSKRLRELMDAKRVSAQDLADTIGGSSLEISQLLARERRPQKDTIFKLAEALDVSPAFLWPDIEVVDMLDAVADFQRDNCVMTHEEAEALGDTSRRNPPRIPAKPLTGRRQ